MGVQRHGGRSQGVVWAFALMVLWAASADGAKLAGVQPEHAPDPFAALAAPPSPAGARASEAAPSETPALTKVEAAERGCGYARGAAWRSRVVASSNRPHFVRGPGLWARPFVGLMALTAVLLFVAWRSPGAPPAARSAARPASSAPNPRDVVCLACSRCNRVVDLPRHRLDRHVFCPRCGSTLPREV